MTMLGSRIMPLERVEFPVGLVSRASFTIVYEKENTMEEKTVHIPTISCGHCVATIKREVEDIKESFEFTPGATVAVAAEAVGVLRDHGRRSAISGTPRR